MGDIKVKNKQNGEMVHNKNAHHFIACPSQEAIYPPSWQLTREADQIKQTASSEISKPSSAKG